MKIDFMDSVAGLRFFRTITASCLGSLLLVATASAAPSASLEASRLSGPAPLAVFFDATGTTDTSSSADPFRQFGYKFEFDDPSAGTWANSKLPKNEQIGGPLAAHVFETPGTYVVQVTAKSLSGQEDTQTVSIEVLSPDSVFAGANTVCVSMTADFTGCPAGAQNLMSPGSWPSFSSNSRYLLHANQDFSSLGSVSVGNVKDMQIGSFGAGAKPKVSRIQLQTGNPDNQGYTGDWISRVTVMDMDTSGIGNESVAKDILLLRNKLDRGGLIEFAGAFTWYLSKTSSLAGWQNPENIFFVENLVDRSVTASTSGNPMDLSAQGRHLVLMGNTFRRPIEHNVRIWQASKAFIAHNFFDGISHDNIRVCLKIHSSGLDPVIIGSFAGAAGLNQRTSELVVANNHCGVPESNLQWMMAIRPQNAQSAEGIEYVIVEDNDFENGPNHVSDLIFTGHEMTDRGNWNLTNNGPTQAGTASNDVLPSEWIGPYHTGQASMRDLFSGDLRVPSSPIALSAN